MRKARTLSWIDYHTMLQLSYFLVSHVTMIHSKNNQEKWCAVKAGFIQMPGPEYTQGFSAIKQINVYVNAERTHINTWSKIVYRK